MESLRDALLRPGRTIATESFTKEIVAWYDPRDHGSLHLGNACMTKGDVVILGEESLYTHGRDFREDNGNSHRAIIQKVGGGLVGVMEGHSVSLDGNVAKLPSAGVSETVWGRIDLPDVPDVIIGEPWQIQGQPEDPNPVAAVWFDAQTIYSGELGKRILLPTPPPFRDLWQLIPNSLV